MRTRWGALVVSLLMFLAACACMGLIYHWSDDMCRERGGHTEWIYGGRGGWTCDGANR
jgi:hypothetical protein